ncbi:MAG: hypothetical protein DRP26_05325, partial [Candidatus Zixiibacteriota bacterium]
MKVLFLTGEIPYPVHTGAKIRTFNLIKHLSKFNKITLLTFLYEANDLTKVEFIRDYCYDIKYVWRKKPEGLAFYLSLIQNLFSKNPFIVDKYYYKSYQDRLNAELVSGNYDIVHCDSVSLSWATFGVKKVAKVLTEHNMEATIWRRYHQEENNPLKKLYIGSQSKRVFEFEKKVCQIFDAVIAVSEQDKQRIGYDYNAQNVVVVPNGVDTDYFKPSERVSKPSTLIFTGSMDWRPNQDGIYYFYKKIWPLILIKRPGTHLWIVGRKPPAKIKAMARADERIHVTGTVEDIRNYMEDAEVYIVPLRIGGGSRLKILEAWAMKKPVISTTVGAEGIDVTDGENIVLADTPEKFTEKVL